MVVLTWNEEANIGSCLASLAAQGPQDFEVLVIDAASRDQTPNLVRRLAPTLPFPVHLEALNRRLPIGEARNLGVALARSPYVAFLSADAELDRDWIHQARESLRDHQVVFGHQTHDPRRWTVGASVRGLRYQFPRHPVQQPERYASNVAAAYRIDVLQTFPFDPALNGAEDLILARKAQAAGFQITYNPAMNVRHHDVVTWKAELRKNLREGYGWGQAARHLGPFGQLLAWAAALVLLPLGFGWMLGVPWGAAALLGLLWAPTARRAARTRKRVPRTALAKGMAASPFFDLAFLGSYLAGWTRRNRNGHAPPAVAPSPPTSARPRHATVFLILDAGRADYVRPDSMPFLHGLAQGAVRGRFESPPGFAQRTTMFTGRYPDQTGNLSAFVYDPQHSPFAWLRRWRSLGRWVRPRRVLFPVRKTVEWITRRRTGTYHADPAWIPIPFLPFFRPCEDMRPVYEPGALGPDSLFDLCRRHGVRFRYLAHPVSGHDPDVHATLVRELRAGAPYDLYVAQLSVLDQDGHVHGPFSPHIQQTVLRDLDGTVASIHAALQSGYESWDLFVCGDHGMAPVRRRVDIQRALAASGARPGRDYVVFVNSTLALVWYESPKGRRRVRPILARLPGTRLLTPADRRRLRIPTDPRWGHDMVDAEPGVLFWPDYFHVTDSRIVGMHGYLDKRDESYGLAILASSRARPEGLDVGLRSLVDVFPTLCQLLGLPLPPGQAGQSLLPPERTQSSSTAPQPRPALQVPEGP